MERRGYKNHFCSNKCCIAYNNNLHVNILPIKRREEYYKNPKLCLQCNSILSYKKEKENIKYCSRKCSALHTQRNRGHCKWDENGKQRLRELAKRNPYFNGKLRSSRKKNGQYIRCPICNAEFYKTTCSKKRICCSKKCSIVWINKTGYLKGKTGGYREKGGRGKQGWYKGYYCNSSWELAWVIYQLEHDVKFKRNTKGFEYEFGGRKYRFYPDFQIDGCNDYVEVKGYIDRKNAAKISSFPNHLNVIGRQEIKPFIEYAEAKYGKDYIRLYEPKKTS